MPAISEELHWNPDSGGFDADALPDVDAVVNLLRARGSHCATVTGVEHVIPDFNGEPSPACRGPRVAPGSVGAQRRNG
jgi:hypothetical protein